MELHVLLLFYIVILIAAAVNFHPCYGFQHSSISKRIERQNRGIHYYSVSTAGDAMKATQVSVFFDITFGDDEEIGRLIFTIPDTQMLPLHIENFLKLCTQERLGIDPRSTYVGCEFEFSPQYIEGFPQYRWAHVLKGKGRNTIGRPEERIVDPGNLKRCVHSIYGGVYYGIDFESIPEREAKAVVLALPLSGPGRGSSQFEIVRVGESPQEWRERLLLNSVVLGWMQASSLDTLKRMARQTRSPTRIVGSGILKDE